MGLAAVLRVFQPDGRDVGKAVVGYARMPEMGLLQDDWANLDRSLQRLIWNRFPWGQLEETVRNKSWEAQETRRRP